MSILFKVSTLLKWQWLVTQTGKGYKAGEEEEMGASEEFPLSFLGIPAWLGDRNRWLGWSLKSQEINSRACLGRFIAHQ